MHLKPYAVTALVLSTCLVALAGCAGSSAPARLYVLTPAPEAARPSAWDRCGYPACWIGRKS